jgi:uncharacterized protein
VKRFFSHPLVRLALIAGAVAVVLTGVAIVERGHHSPATLLPVTWALLVLLFGLVVLVERLTTGRLPAAIGWEPRGAARSFFLGLAFGAALFSIVILELAAGGHYRIEGSQLTWHLATSAALLLAGAAIEELLFRGVLFRLLEEWSGTWIALAISAAFFGAAHAFNPGASWVSSISIAVEAGVLLGAAYVVAKNLWFPIGLHFGWNYFEGPIYGTQVSGTTLKASALTAHVSGPAWLSGGAFGPEAGVCAVATCTLAAIALLLYASRHSLIVGRAKTAV